MPGMRGVGRSVLPVSALVGSETHGQDPGEGLDFLYLNLTCPSHMALVLFWCWWLNLSRTTVPQYLWSSSSWLTFISPWATRAKRRGGSPTGAASLREAQRAEGNRLLRSHPQPLRGNLPEFDRAGSRGACDTSKETVRLRRCLEEAVALCWLGFEAVGAARRGLSRRPCTARFGVHRHLHSHRGVSR